MNTKSNVKIALSNSFGFGGHNSTIAVKNMKAKLEKQENCIKRISENFKYQI